MLQWSALQPYPSRGDGQASFADAKVRLFQKLAKLSLLLFGKTRKTQSYTLYIIYAREGKKCFPAQFYILLSVENYVYLYLCAYPSAS